MNERRMFVPASVLALLACSTLAGLPIFNDATIEAHRDRQAELLEAQQAIRNKAEDEKRDLTEAELRELTSLTDEFDQKERQIEAHTRSINQAALLSAPRGRQTTPEPTDADIEDADRPVNRSAPAPVAQRRAEPQARRPVPSNGGFRHMGDFANSVRNAALGRDPDQRLRNAAASTLGSEGVGADGGFAVPPDFSAAIASKVFGEDSLVARTDRTPVTGNSLTLPADMTTPWDTTGGIQAYWGGEAQAMTQSKPKLEEVTVKAHKLHVLVPMTEELLEDAPAMNGYLNRKAPEKMDFKLSDAIVRGSGAGQPLGFLNSPSLVTVAAEGAQTADTINATNISKMYARMPVSSLSTAVWLIHPDAQPQLDLMTIGQQPVYMPPGGMSESPYGRLKGRPVIPHQVCETVGDLGDLMFVDLAQYLAITKTGGGRDANGFKSDVSMHLWFDQDLVAFKFTIRIGGQPWWSTTTSPRDGSNAMSPFVALAAR